jgi:hypothetical protein
MVYGIAIFNLKKIYSPQKMGMEAIMNYRQAFDLGITVGKLEEDLIPNMVVPSECLDAFKLGYLHSRALEFNEPEDFFEFVKNFNPKYRKMEEHSKKAFSDSSPQEEQEPLG